MGLDYVDIFYSHRPDPETPFEETAQALDLMVHQGKALYIGISNYSAEQTAEIAAIFKDLEDAVHHPPTGLQYVQSLDRGWATGCSDGQ
jgi:L-glyceraldehyde 3-phosphate reductase